MLDPGSALGENKERGGGVFLYLRVQTMNKLFLTTSLLCASIAAAEPRDAEAILKEYGAIKEPLVDATKLKDPAYFSSFFGERMKVLEKRDALALELYQAHPDHPEAVPLMLKRWGNMASTRSEKAIPEMEQFLKDHSDSKVKADVLYQRALAHLGSERGGPQKTLAAIEDFIQASPKDDRGGNLLAYAASQLDDQPAQLQLYRRVVADYAGSRAALSAAGSIRKVEGVGQPFELAFEEAVSGNPVAMKELAGKVVVVDFWATWCGPCVAEMPTMKELYAKYKDQGVEFIGISLDNADGGLDKLKTFVHEKGISWPQYFQGNGWESKFSTSWGINSIPCIFIVDSAGKLHSTEARGKLETLIPELLKKREDKTQ
jgi:thiol-disulfide isomerase/thioredoxin